MEKTNVTEEVLFDGIPFEDWRAIRKEAGLKIDPETAEVRWEYALTLDPYGVLPELPVEYQQVGREYFARSPGSEIWVSFDDLPEETIDALRRKDRPAERNTHGDQHAYFTRVVRTASCRSFHVPEGCPKL